MAKAHRIAVIPGDGIGKEVVPEGIRALEAAGKKFGIAFQWDEFPWSCDYYVKYGRMMPEDWFEQIHRHEAIFSAPSAGRRRYLITYRFGARSFSGGADSTSTSTCGRAV